LNTSASNKWFWLLIIANAALLLLITTTESIGFSMRSKEHRIEPLSTNLSPVCVGIVTAQACILGTFLACARRPFLFRLRWFYRGASMLWFCYVIPLLPYNFHWQWPWCVAADVLLVAVPAFLAVGIVRLVSGRGVTVEDDNSSDMRSRTSILDMLILMSVIALMLGMSVRFRSEPAGWDGLIYLVMIVLGVVIGIPIGAVLPLLSLGFLGESKRTVLATAMVWSVAIGIGVSVLILYGQDREAVYDTLLFSISGLSVVLANTFALRGLGYRFRKLPRSPKRIEPQPQYDSPISDA
jgi:hypothetical protein